MTTITIKELHARTGEWVRKAGQTGEITVTDRGRGIADADTAHILDPLYRGNNVEGVPGYGIGLAITQKIIDLHQGILRITSQENQGTTVTIELPGLA